MENAGIVQTLAGSWLALQCEMIPKVHRGAVYLGVNGETQPIATACWPEGTSDSPALNAATKLVLDRKCPVLCGDDEPAGISRSGNLNIACPLIVEGSFTGVVAVEVAGASEQQQRAVMQLLQWGSTWLEFLIRRETSSVTNSLMTATRVVATCLEHENFRAAATAAATELAVRLRCERVSIGFRDGRRVALRAISHSANFSRKTNLAGDIEAAMDEALMQGDAVVFPASAAAPPATVTEHATLVKNHDIGHVCSIPFGNEGELCGVITFERADDQPFDAAVIELCEGVSSLLGPILELKRKEARWAGAVVRDDFSSFVGCMLGRRHTAIKLALVMLAAVVAYLGIATGVYRVAADAAVQGTIQREIVASSDGNIATGATRAGDLARNAEVPGRVEDQDLQLERARGASQREQYGTEYRQALARRDRSQTRVLSAQRDQANAHLKPLKDELSRTELVTPLVRLIFFVALSGFIGYLLFMKRIPRHIDSSAVIPDRVKTALDVLSEGVVLVNENAEIVLANTAFQRELGEASESLLGRNLSDMRWRALDDETAVELPWQHALEYGESALGCVLQLATTADSLRTFVINGSPILDDTGSARGAMVTFDDITELEKKNDELKTMLDTLQEAEKEVRRQNEKLQILATRDPLTACLNRRSFNEHCEQALITTEDEGRPLSCIVMDIDHFKSVNDTFGHAVGDKVIQQVVNSTRSGLRSIDIIGRYGGEEFCILLPGLDLDQAAVVAERLRFRIENEAREALADSGDRIITSSFGVASTEYCAFDAHQLLDSADRALYVSKNSGRNRVTRVDEMETEQVA